MNNPDGLIKKVDIMDQQPGCCTHCGTVPTDEQDPDNGPLPAYMFEGTDVNWGDQMYLCQECVDILCDLNGRVTVEEHEKLKSKYKFMRQKVQQLVRRDRVLVESIKQMAAGDKVREKLLAQLETPKKKKGKK